MQHCVGGYALAEATRVRSTALRSKPTDDEKGVYDMALTQTYQGSKLGFFTRLSDRILDTFLQIGQANKAVSEVQFLQSLSDKELERRGIKRDEIVQHVFQDKFWL